MGLEDDLRGHTWRETLLNLETILEWLRSGPQTDRRDNVRRLRNLIDDLDALLE